MSDKQDEMTLREAAERAGVSKSTVRNWINRGHLTEYWGWRGEIRERRVKSGELQDYLNRRKDPAKDNPQFAGNVDKTTSQTPHPSAETPQLFSTRFAGLLDRIVDVLDRAQTRNDDANEILDQAREGLEAKGELRALKQENRRLAEENDELRNQLAEAQKRIRQLEQIPFVPQVAGVREMFGLQ